ncbi:MAG TPA: hypothetical protein VK660_10900 [Xanthomonadaceae bacterium]|jgi:hypothetical protein|nr:hypothetical protein [Xanthomonadaceae bacterium]
MTSRPQILSIAIAAGAIAASLMLAGCGKSLSDRAAEAVVHAATGNKVDINKSGSEMTVKTDKGVAKISSGTNLSIPTDFPSDVHLPTAAYSVHNVMQMGPTMTVVTLHSTTPMSALYSEYDTKMKSSGWKEVVAIQSSDSGAMLNFQKDNRVVTVTLSTKPGSSDGGTDVNVQHVVQKPGG